MPHDEQLTPERVVELGLPTGPCCCEDHPHDWYARTDAAGSWVECCACGDVAP